MSPTPGPDSGLYAVLLHLGNSRRIRIGRKGLIKFFPGYYVYIGSARRGLEGRLARHRLRRKTLRWHVDYLRSRARWLGAWTLKDKEISECRLAGWFLSRPGASIPMPGFGASDCRCPGHLVHYRRLAGTGLHPERPVAGPSNLQWSG